MSALRLLPAARRDLDEIWSYSASHWGTDQAERYVLDILEAGEALADGRRQGRPIDDVRPGYRKLAIGSHFICYRVARDRAIEIVRILHQQMDVRSRIDPSPGDA